MPGESAYHYQREVLSNGLTFGILPLPHLHTVHLLGIVRHGAVHDPRGLEGLSHLLEHLHVSVSPAWPTRSLMSEHCQRVAPLFNAQVTKETTQIFMATRPDDADAAGQLMVEMLTARRFERTVVEEELRLLATEDLDPENRRQFTRHMAHLLQAHPYARSGRADSKSLTRLAQCELECLDQEVYAARNLILIVVGPVNSALPSSLKSRLEALPDNDRRPTSLPDPPDMKLPTMVRMPIDGKYVPVVAGFALKGTSRFDPTRISLLEHGIVSPTSRLFHELRYKTAAAYRFWSEANRYGNQYMIEVTAIGRRRTRAEIAEAMLWEFLGCRDLERPAVWFEPTRSKLLFHILSAKDQPGELAGRIGIAEAWPKSGYDFTIDEEIEFLSTLKWPEFAESMRRMLCVGNFYFFFGSRIRRNPADIQGRIRRLAEAMV